MARPLPLLLAILALAACGAQEVDEADGGDSVFLLQTGLNIGESAITNKAQQKTVPPLESPKKFAVDYPHDGPYPKLPLGLPHSHPAVFAAAAAAKVEQSLASGQGVLEVEPPAPGPGPPAPGSPAPAVPLLTPCVFVQPGSAQAVPAPAKSQDKLIWRNAVAEFLAMTLFVIMGCGSAMAIAKDPGSAWVLQVAFAFGLAITVLAYSLGRYSGGQINCAVTLALWVSGQLSWQQSLVNFAAQMLGSVLGAITLGAIFPKHLDKTGSLGSNAVAEGFHFLGVLIAEFVMTFVLVITVFESGLQTAPASGIAVIPIGFAVFLSHLVLIPIDGCSINPTRSFGPALVATFRDGKVDYFKDMWIFWVGPLLGALVGAGVHELFLLSL